MADLVTFSEGDLKLKTREELEKDGFMSMVCLCWGIKKT